MVDNPRSLGGFIDTIFSCQKTRVDNGRKTNRGRAFES